MNPSQLADMFSGYYCVFVGNPSICIPYAVFTSKKQAEIWNDGVAISRTYSIMTVKKWEKQFTGSWPTNET